MACKTPLGQVRKAETKDGRKNIVKDQMKKIEAEMKFLKKKKK